MTRIKYGTSIKDSSHDLRDGGRACNVTDDEAASMKCFEGREITITQEISDDTAYEDVQVKAYGVQVLAQSAEGVSDWSGRRPTARPLRPTTGPEFSSGISRHAQHCREHQVGTKRWRTR